MLSVSLNLSTEPQIPTDVTSPNFSRVFGSNTSAFELLVIKRRIMGPCWIKVQKPHVEHQGVSLDFDCYLSIDFLSLVFIKASWCKMEVTVNDPKDFNPFSETDAHAPKDMPPLTVTSLSVRTIVNHAENIREIVCVTARIWSNCKRSCVLSSTEGSGLMVFCSSDRRRYATGAATMQRAHAGTAT